MAALMEEYSAVTALCKETRGQRDMARTQAAELKLELEAAEKKLKNGVDKIESPQVQPARCFQALCNARLTMCRPVIQHLLTQALRPCSPCFSHVAWPTVYGRCISAGTSRWLTGNCRAGSFVS